MARPASRSAAPLEKKSLHDPVFERVERHDAQASTLNQEAFGGSESQLEFIEFIVDEYPQGQIRASPDAACPICLLRQPPLPQSWPIELSFEAAAAPAL